MFVRVWKVRVSGYLLCKEGCQEIPLKTFALMAILFWILQCRTQRPALRICMDLRCRSCDLCCKAQHRCAECTGSFHHRTQYCGDCSSTLASVQMHLTYPTRGWDASNHGTHVRDRGGETSSAMSRELSSHCNLTKNVIDSNVGW